jgi:FixJ family two-component response regulator
VTSPKNVIIAVIDDDASVRRALTRLLVAFDYQVRTYASAREFLNARETQPAVCLIVDQQMEETTGLELQHQLRHA